MKPRSVTCNLIVGAQETGKSTFINESLASYSKKVLVIDSDGEEEIWQKLPIISVDNLKRYTDPKGRMRVLYDDDDKDFFKKIRSSYRNGMLVIDDGMYYVTDGKHSEIRKMLLRRRQYNIDIFFVCHGMTEVPPSYWTFASHLVLFNTLDLFERAKAKTPDVFIMQERVMEVKKLALKNPYARKIYPLK